MTAMAFLALAAFTLGLAVVLHLGRRDPRPVPVRVRRKERER